MHGLYFSAGNPHAQDATTAGQPRARMTPECCCCVAPSGEATASIRPAPAAYVDIAIVG